METCRRCGETLTTGATDCAKCGWTVGTDPTMANASATDQALAPRPALPGRIAIGTLALLGAAAGQLAGGLTPLENPATWLILACGIAAAVMAYMGSTSRGTITVLLGITLTAIVLVMLFNGRGWKISGVWLFDIVAISSTALALLIALMAPADSVTPNTPAAQGPPSEVIAMDDYVGALRALGYRVDAISAGTWQVSGKGGVDRVAYGAERLRAIHAELTSRGNV